MIAGFFFFSRDDINIRQTSKICFSTSDDMNLRQNSMMSFSASDDINIRQNSEVFVFLYLMILSRKTDIIEFCLRFISYYTEKQLSLNFV